MLELYHNDISVYAQKVRFVHAEKGIDRIGNHLDLMTGQQTNPAYLKIHPMGLVPALGSGDFVSTVAGSCALREDNWRWT